MSWLLNLPLILKLLSLWGVYKKIREDLPVVLDIIKTLTHDWRAVKETYPDQKVTMVNVVRHSALKAVKQGTRIIPAPAALTVTAEGPYHGDQKAFETDLETEDRIAKGE